MNVATGQLNPPRLGPIPRVDVEPGRCVVLEGVEWPAYEQIGDALRDRPHVRMTFDRGRLEIMTPSLEHERLKVLLDRLLQVLAEEADVALCGFGSTTYKRDVLERGLEPDQCYYHRNFPRVRGLRRIDLNRDPPPDLAVEIDVAHSSIDRTAIYAQLGVPELWRLKGDSLRVHLLSTEGRYVPAESSPTFPNIPIGGLIDFLRIGFGQDDTAMVRSFRTWVREQLRRG
jgi:Uma2 family endonuclease